MKKLKIMPFSGEEDLSRIMEIEHASFDEPWTDELYFRVLCRRNVSCMVLRISAFFHAKQIVGYIVFRTGLKKLEIWNLAVHPDHRRRGYGTLLILYLKRRAERGVRKPIELEISERNLLGQLFFRSNGFQATSVLRGHYSEEHDAYKMIWTPSSSVRNRLLKHCHASDF